MAQHDLYETDVVEWARRQVDALRQLAAASRSNDVDWANLIEEIESLGRSQVSGLERKLTLILAHLIKVVSAPDSQASRGWRSEIASHQRVVRKRFPNSVRRLLDWDDLWADARDDARDSLAEWGDSLVGGLPRHNPFQLDELISSDFDVDDALAKMANAISPIGT